MVNKKELLEQMKNARSWKEFAYSLEEVYAIMSTEEEPVNVVSNDEEVQMLKKKVERLSDENKKLREENKKLKVKE